MDLEKEILAASDDRRVSVSAKGSTLTKLALVALALIALGVLIRNSRR